MTTVTTTRRIDLTGLAFPATMRHLESGYEVEADLPLAELRAAVEAAPDLDAVEQAATAERTRVRLPAALRTKVKNNASDPANATAYTTAETTRLLTWLAVVNRDA